MWWETVSHAVELGVHEGMSPNVLRKVRFLLPDPQPHLLHCPVVFLLDPRAQLVDGDGRECDESEQKSKKEEEPREPWSFPLETPWASILHFLSQCPTGLCTSPSTGLTVQVAKDPVQMAVSHTGLRTLVLE